MVVKEKTGCANRLDNLEGVEYHCGMETKGRFRCPVCGGEWPTKREFAYHVVYCHFVTLDDVVVNKPKCGWCERSDTIKGLIDHLLDVGVIEHFAEHALAGGVK